MLPKLLQGETPTDALSAVTQGTEPAHRSCRVCQRGSCRKAVPPDPGRGCRFGGPRGQLHRRRIAPVSTDPTTLASIFGQRQLGVSLYGLPGPILDTPRQTEGSNLRAPLVPWDGEQSALFDHAVLMCTSIDKCYFYEKGNYSSFLSHE
eukprot:gene284-biopygen15120